MTDGDGPEWWGDRVTTRTGVAIPVRATARRPTWQQLPLVVRSLIEDVAGARVARAESAGTGFTPGFASRLDLVDGRRIFVKAASSADDALHGWPMSDAYREEVRKLTALPAGVGAPPVLWHRDLDLAGARWVVTAFGYVDGAPPRRPWRLDQLHLVLDKLAAIAQPLNGVPAELGLKSLATELVDGYADRLASVRSAAGDSEWHDTLGELCADAAELTAGGSIVHLDLRDDNLLIDSDGEVWIVDWNWPVVGAHWVDLVCVLLSVRGDGLDADALLAQHPLSRDVSARSIDALLAVLWTFWVVAVDRAVPAHSPYLRAHQRWYLDVTESWLRDRLARR